VVFRRIGVARFLSVVMMLITGLFAIVASSSLAAAAPPLPVGPSFPVAVNAAFSYSCALLNTGQVTCWGYNGHGSLGAGDYSTGPAGTMVALPGGTRATAISTAGGFHTCALLTTGQVACWGDNFFGQLGNGANSTLNTPGPIVALPRGATAAAIAAGETHTCALLNTGQVSCWGDNSQGQLGNPGDLVQLPAGSAATAVSLGQGFGSALLTTGRVICWGSNGSGQLGVGDTTDRLAPGPLVPLPGGATAKAVDVGHSHVCVILNTGQAVVDAERAVGRDRNHGDVGDGGRPVEVAI
jgi:alpha-tubulin suppressor-like RCC1 family protein